MSQQICTIAARWSSGFAARCLLILLLPGCFFDGERSPLTPDADAKFDVGESTEETSVIFTQLDSTTDLPAVTDLAAPEIAGHIPNKPDTSVAADTIEIVQDVGPAEPCTPSAPNACDDGKECTVDSCDPVDGCWHLNKYFSNVFPFPSCFPTAIVSDASGYVTLFMSIEDPTKYQLQILARFSPLGTLVWSQTYGSTQKYRVASSLAINSNGLVFAGLADYGAENDAWVVRTDLEGNVLWDQKFGDPDHVESALAVLAMPDGVIFVGQNGTINWPDAVSKYAAWLVRTDDSGTILWAHVYPAPGVATPSAVVMTSDGFAFTGTRGTTKKDQEIFLTRTDAAGNELWTQTFGHNPDLYGGGLTALADGFALSCRTDATGTGGLDLRLIRTTANGLINWERTYGTVGDDFAIALVALPNGWALLGGLHNPTKPKNDLSLLRLDNDGNPEWQQSYGINENAGAGAMVAATDGGVAIFGFVNAENDLLLIRTDAYGHASCAESGACFAKTVADCDDKNQCTADLCDGKTGCGHVNLPDDATCAVAKKCKAGKCL